MRAVIERESHEWKVRSDTIDDIGGDPLEELKHEQRLGPKQKQPNYCEGAGRHQKHQSVSHAKSMNYRFSRGSPELSCRVGSSPERPLENLSPVLRRGSLPDVVAGDPFLPNTGEEV